MIRLPALQRRRTHPHGRNPLTGRNQARVIRSVCFGVLLGIVNLVAFTAKADTVYYTLENVILDDATQMTGIFSWTFDVGNFESGVGEFIALDIPWTAHNQDDLDANFDVGQSIEITLAGSVHDDGVDITLFLTQALTPTTSASIDLVRSKYEIGGNEFDDGLFLSESIAPTNSILSVAATPPGFVTLSWEPDLPGCVLQETSSLSPANRTNSASGGPNPVVVPATGPTKFYRLAAPLTGSLRRDFRRLNRECPQHDAGPPELTAPPRDKSGRGTWLRRHPQTRIARHHPGEPRRWPSNPPCSSRLQECKPRLPRH